MSIEITTPPTKTNYLAGDSFNPAGMVVTASYGNGYAVLATAEVGGYSISPNVLTDGTTYVTISYSEGGDSFTAIQTVTVTHKLTGIQVTTNPSKTTYEYDDSLVTSGMVVQASYSDGATANVSGYTCTPTTFSTVGTQVVTVSYTENGVNQTTTFSVTVNRKSVTKPTWKSNLTYNGNTFSVDSTSYWNNYNTTYMTIGGTTSAAAAGTYTAKFTPKDNYRWADGTTSTISVNWTINKANGSLSVSPTTVTINGDNYSNGVAVTITRAGNGAISYSPKEITGLTLTLNNNVLTVKGDGSTAVAATNVTISVAAGDNHLAPANVTISVGAEYWSWGADGSAADATWFKGLQNYLKNNSTTTIANQNWVGKTKSVTLTSAVQGTTTHLITCIDVNKDGNNTATFQTTNMLASYLSNGFGSSAVWSSSYAKTACQSYYNAFPGKDYIKTVSKGTNTTYDSSSVAYTDETVFLPSIHEMGLASYSYAPTIGEYTNGVSSAYSYYSSNTTRVKKLGDSGSADWYWTRSRSAHSSTYVCFVHDVGSAGYNGYSNTGIGLAPAFVIG